MDVLINFALEFGFVRLSSVLHLPIVFHCVPGAGKSSLIRACITADSRFRAFTAGIADEPNLSGCLIEKYTGELPEGKYILLDEYTTILGELPPVYAIFGDPIQNNTQQLRRADFVCNRSKRFGSCTAALLRELNFDIVASANDVVECADIFKADPFDQVIYFEEEVGCLLRRHLVDCKNLSEIVGQTFEKVTFVTSERTPKINRAAAFQCLTRHRVHLLILNPYAAYGPA